MFDTRDKTSNAQHFIENLDRTQNRTKKSEIKVVAETEPPKQQLIMDIDPKKIAKKDEMFLKFFSMYGKNFIREKKHGSKIIKNEPDQKRENESRITQVP